MSIECISCGEANDGGYEVEDGPGPFCSGCWLKLEDHFDNNTSAGGPTYSLKTPVHAFIIQSQREDLQGLEVGFDSEGYVGLRCVANNKAGFILTSEAALLLADLILREKNGAEGIYLAE